MKRKSLLLMLLLAFAMPWAAMAQFSGGNGSASDPYQIANAADWNTLANGISSYKSSHFIMTADITTGVTTMVGTSSNRFQGTFNGNGHTLKVTISGNDVAPFAYIQNATIKNLLVTGSVTGNNYHAGGLVGRAYSSNTIQNCRVNVDLQIYVLGGGIVGHNGSANTKLIGCIFDGTIVNNHNDGDKNRAVGGLIGWCDDNATFTFTDCLFAGTYAMASGINSVYFHPVGCRANNQQGISTTISNCYYTLAPQGSDPQNHVFTNEGRYAYSITGGTDVNVSNAGTATPHSVSGITGYGTDWGGILYGGTLYGGQGKSISLTLEYTGDGTLEEFVATPEASITGNGPYTLTMPNNNVTINATTAAPPVLHDSDGNYMTWAQFAANVMNNVNYSGKTVYLDADVTVTEPIGIHNAASGNGDHFFNGTFDGQGHTVTLDMTTTHDKYGLFGVLNNAIVKDLIIDGTINSTHYHTGGLTGYTLNTCDITNCVSNVTINSTVSSTDNGHCGGFVGEIGGGSSVTFNGCAFTGKLTCTNYSGGFVGRFINSYSNSSYLTFNDCLYASTNSSCTGSSYAAFVYKTSSSNTRFTISNSYYTTTSLGTSQGKQGYTVTGETGVGVALNGTSTNHTVSQIQGYGSTPNKGLSYNGTIIAGSGDAVSLNLSYANAGSGTVNYNATYGSSTATLSGNANPYTLTMPAANTTINVIGFNKTITAYNNSERGNYYLIASPVGTVTPSSNNGFLSGTYNLYYFDQNGMDDDVLNEWRNYSSSPFNIESGKGYLYASKNGTTLTFTGTPYGGNGQVTLSKTEGVRFSGWNLVGNPFPKTAYIGDRAFYIINPDGRAEIIPATTGSAIEPMEGIFVIATTNNETLTFSTEEQAVQPSAMVALNVYNAAVRGNASVIDRAIVSFTEGQELPKFQLNPNHTKLFIPQGDKDYAVVHTQAEGELPLNFKAENNGRYTLSVDIEEVSFDYLHLIDNMTGADVDLLATPTYTFNARTTDYASRFRLVFAATGIEENGASTGSATFAYYNGSEWNIANNGEATLQVIDIMGRVLSSQVINGNTSINLNQSAGVYMLRLVDGNSVRTQKVIVK